ncbi:hypothetical protein JB92DRAFT_2176070 [Gautieria morchelliformis]|nr:hypothetical protein JB92DRAFT_2176070 [Gautieria morchelliformis]
MAHLEGRPWLCDDIWTRGKRKWHSYSRVFVIYSVWRPSRCYLRRSSDWSITGWVGIQNNTLFPLTGVSSHKGLGRRDSRRGRRDGLTGCARAVLCSMGAGCGLASAFSKERRHTQLDEAYKGRSAPAWMHRYDDRFSGTCDVTDARPHTQPRHPSQEHGTHNVLRIRTVHTARPARLPSSGRPRTRPFRPDAGESDGQPGRCYIPHTRRLPHLPPSIPGPVGQASRTSFPAPDYRRPSPGPRGFALLSPRT